MADLGNRANVNSAIDLLLDDLQPDEAIQPSDHNVLLKDILDTLANGLSTVLRTGNTTDGENLTITSSSIFQFANGSNGRLQSDTLTAFRNWTLPDTTGTIALLSDITGGASIYTESNTAFTDVEITTDNSLRFLNGNVRVYGSGTTTGSAFSIYDNDTVPAKLWDFLDNGDVNLGVDSVLNIGTNDLDINGSGLFSVSNGAKSISTSWNTHTTFNLNNGSGTTYSLYSGNASGTFNAGEFGIGVGSIIPIKIFNGSSVALGNVTKGNLDTNYNLQTNGTALIGGNLDTKLGTNEISLDHTNYPKLKISNGTNEYWIIEGDGTGITFTSGDLYFYDNTNSRKLLQFKANGTINAPTLPTSSTGTVVGDVWSQNGTVKIGNPSANITTVASVGGLTVNADTTEMAKVLALATNITINAPTGTPNDNQSLWFRILDNGTSRTITLNAVFEDYTGNFPTSTTAGKYLIFAGKWNADEGKWNILAWKVQP